MDAIEHRISQLKGQIVEIKHATRVSLEGIEKEIARLEALRGHVVGFNGATGRHVRAVEEARDAYRRHSFHDSLIDPRD